MTSVTTTPLASSNRSGRLKYASAQELPSFPSLGLKNDGAAASAAATLGWANQKSPELWKPDSTSKSASTAALLANDKMTPASDPQRVQSAAVSQAALMAAGSVRRRENNKSTPPSLWGSSAANLAFNASKSASKSSQQPSPTLASTALTRQSSMRAAKGAMAGQRPRAISSPMPPSQSYPDKANAASNALSAATHAHRPSMRTMDIPIEEAGAVPFTTMDRQMYTSRPPVKPEVDEKRRNDVLHASAVAMAKRMYNQQEQQKKAGRNTENRARASSFTRHGEGGSRESTEEPTPIVYGNLQEAAYRLAQERLAKLQDEHQKNRDLQQYYGATGPHRHGKLGTIRNKLTRRRSSSDGDLMLEDQMRSRQIRSQMSLFNTKLMEVDEQKRTKDREALLAAAQRNVRARMQDMDKKIQEKTGMASLASSGHGHQSEWEWKAQAAAQARFDASHNPNHGKIDLGGGKFMDREEVDQIAAKKVQPLLDEINKNAELEYERRMQQKADEERRKDEEEGAKAREREVQAIHKKLKDQEKAEEKIRKAEIKEIERHQKEQAKAAKAEQKRLAKDGKEKEKEAVVLPPVSREGADGRGGVDETALAPEAKPEEKENTTLEPTSGWPDKMIKNKSEKKPETTAGSGSGGGLARAISIKFHKVQKKDKEPKGKETETITKSAPAPITIAPVATGGTKGVANETTTSPSSPPSATTNKVKTWIKSHFRSKSFPPATEEAGEVGSPSSKTKDDTRKGEAKKDTGFIGGAALARLSASSSGSDGAASVKGAKRSPVTSPVLARRGSFAEETEPHRDSLREVALAGRVDYLTDPDRSPREEKGETSHSALRGGNGTGVPIPPPAPVPVPIPVVITTSEVSAQPQTATILNTTSYPSPTTRRTNRPLNNDGISAESTDQEDEWEEKPELKIYSPVPLRLKKEETSAIEKFGTTDWDITPRTVKSKERTGSVSSMSSTDLDDELDSDDEKDERYSLERFEETRDKLDRPGLPPRVSSADVIGVVDDEDLGENSMLGRPRPVERGLSPYRGSRFSEAL
ncbi:hypothetical protein QBC37DRAFT_194979 [Rhypophila decipiens]|uniref:Eisosome protein 1 n=1 Tax=Rhypophila decipiens TaxID=261697 RepID=A0AAN6Y4F4_9PEZI|nr:hypothetical protein QBC37DRAFT_194979 [Rhypophila decipiens]